MFFKQLALVFKAKPLMYHTHANKCVYTAGFLGGILAQSWTAKNERLTKNPAATLTYDLFKSFLQEQKLSALIRTADLVVKVSDVKQRSSQSISDLIAYLNNLETQFDPLLTDLQQTHHLFVALHPHCCECEGSCQKWVWLLNSHAAGMHNGITCHMGNGSRVSCGLQGTRYTHCQLWLIPAISHFFCVFSNSNYQYTRFTPFPRMLVLALDL